MSFILEWLRVVVLWTVSSIAAISGFAQPDSDRLGRPSSVGLIRHAEVISQELERVIEYLEDAVDDLEDVIDYLDDGGALVEEATVSVGTPPAARTASR